MRTIKHFLTVAALGSGCVTVLMLLPKAAQGVVAALVQVANTTANPVPVEDIDNGARSAFQISKEFPFGMTSSCTSITVYTVPATPPKRLVIELVSFNADTSDSNNGATLDLTTTAAGNRTTHRLGTIPVPFSFFSTHGVHWIASQPSIRVYADPGTDISAQECVLNVATSTPTISLSGYFVNLL